MAPKTKPEKLAKTTGTIAGRAAAATILDDAPLFAGLDDFALVKAERKKVEAPVKAHSMERPATRQAGGAPPGRALPQKAPKATGSQQPDPNALLLSVAEMCTLLKISRATLIRMDKSGRLPGRIKLGGSVRFHRETVEAWLKSLIAPPTT